MLLNRPAGIFPECIAATFLSRLSLGDVRSLNLQPIIDPLMIRLTVGGRAERDVGDLELRQVTLGRRWKWAILVAEEEEEGEQAGGR